MGGRSYTTVEDLSLRIHKFFNPPGTPDDLLAACRASDEEPNTKDRGRVIHELLKVDMVMAGKIRARWIHGRKKIEGDPSSTNGAAPARDNFGTMIPAEFREAVMLSTQVTKLNKRRAAIDEQIHSLELEIAKIDKELESYKPLLDRMKLLVQAVQQIKANPPRV